MKVLTETMATCSIMTAAVLLAMSKQAGNAREAAILHPIPAKTNEVTPRLKVLWELHTVMMGIPITGTDAVQLAQ